MKTIKELENKNFFLIAGPCVIESKKTTNEIANSLSDICNRLEIPFIFKASYKKANRTKLSSFTGIGDLDALKILEDIKNKYNIPVTSDVHSTEEIKFASKFLDIIQIPAFLCRQTDLLIAAAKTNKIVNIKKGQFMDPINMGYAIKKVTEHNNKNIMITERGSMFGYQDLVIDFKSIPIMKSFGVPIIMDITHSLQKPNQNNGETSGNPEFIETIAKASIAAGIDGIFLETHPEPSKAKSDGSNMIELSKVEDLLLKLIKIRKAL